MYNDTITLFNRSGARGGDTWYPTVLHNVNINVDRASVVAKYGATSQDNAVLNVRYTAADGKIMIGSKVWLPPKEWQALDDDAKSKAVTFTSGTGFDFFMLGEWDSDNVISDKDYASDRDFYSHMNKSRDYVFSVTSVSGPFILIPHFEITGK